jgi:TetR/AcrR family transcriptional regulator, transcriptional repressor for nem operon
VGSEARGRPRLTAKGERTRARIVEAAAGLIYERGVASTSLDDIRSAAGVSGSQLSHYFTGKDELVQAVIGYQAATITGNQRQADLGGPQGLRAWRDMVIAQVKSSQGQGGCPLGSLAGQLAETDAQARALIAAGFGQWSAAISDGLRRLHTAGHLRDGTDPDDLAVTLLAALQGGLILAQVQRDTRPLETAVDTVLELAGLSQRDVPADGDSSTPQIPMRHAADPRYRGLALPARDRANPGSAPLRILPEMSGKCRCPDRSAQLLSGRPAGAGSRA